jgi:transcriptional regulator with XRE-family HTH domain
MEFALRKDAQYITQLQAIFSVFAILPRLKSDPAPVSRLRSLREARGISLRELARQIGVDSSNVSYWERTGLLPRSNVLMPIAKALGVTLEELLGEDKPRRVLSPGGKMRQAFEEVSRLPRRQQDHILKVLHALIAQARQQEQESAPNAKL